jgi:restriction endonuclease S subunit
MKVAANAGLINRSTSQVTIAHFTAEKFKEFDIIIPPLADQDRFSRLARRYDHIRTQQHEAERQAEGLFQALLEKAFGEGI